MKCRGWPPLLLALVLSACGNDASNAPEPAAAETAASSEGEVDCFVVESTLPEPSYEHTILAFGDSLFAGYGVCPDQGYPEVLQLALQTREIDARVIDAGVSGDTTAAGLRRIEFVLDGLEAPPDLAIVELGGNDLLRGIAPEQTRANLSGILAELDERDIPVLLMGMRAPPNLGEAFVADFDALYADLARQYDAALLPFFLEPVYDKPELIQPDRVHPTAEGIEALVAATVDEVTEALPGEN